MIYILTTDDRPICDHAEAGDIAIMKQSDDRGTWLVGFIHQTFGQKELVTAGYSFPSQAAAREFVAQIVQGNSKLYI